MARETISKLRKRIKKRNEEILKLKTRVSALTAYIINKEIGIQVPSISVEIIAETYRHDKYYPDYPDARLCVFVDGKLTSFYDGYSNFHDVVSELMKKVGSIEIKKRLNVKEWGVS